MMMMMLGDAENARTENARPENSAPDCRGGKCRTGKCRKRHCMERRTLLMSTQFCMKQAQKACCCRGTSAAPDLRRRLPYSGYISSGSGVRGGREASTHGDAKSAAQSAEQRPGSVRQSLRVAGPVVVLPRTSD